MNIKSAPPNLQSNGSSRMSAESVLKDKIRRKEAELDALQILQRVIPWDDICEEDEGKLWSYFLRSST